VFLLVIYTPTALYSLTLPVNTDSAAYETLPYFGA
jgi:hypothetical protein